MVAGCLAKEGRPLSTMLSKAGEKKCLNTLFINIKRVFYELDIGLAVSFVHFQAQVSRKANIAW